MSSPEEHPPSSQDGLTLETRILNFAQLRLEGLMQIQGAPPTHCTLTFTSNGVTTSPSDNGPFAKGTGNPDGTHSQESLASSWINTLMPEHTDAVTDHNSENPEQGVDGPSNPDLLQRQSIPVTNQSSTLMPEYAKDEEVSKPDLPETPRLKDLKENLKEGVKQLGLPYPADDDELFGILEEKILKIAQEQENAMRALDEAKKLRRLRTPDTAKLDPERIWAVIIGIDAYPERPGGGDQRLWGCVRDALAFKDYLTDDLRVSDNHINLLLGPADLHDDHYNDDFRNSITREDCPKPNRAEIVSTLRSLSTREEIRKDDVIIIFYAGHGAAYRDIPLDGGKSADIEALCPMDRGAIDKAGTIIPDISDREMNSILTEISRAKGHKIAVVLDCCHAGGTTRDVGMVIGTARYIDKLREPTALEVMKDAADIILPGETVWRAGWRPDTKSHVGLAGCRSDEISKEVKRNGVRFGRFTYDLLRALTLDSESEATFEQLLVSLPYYTDQHPILFGYHKHSRIWYSS